jgi:predicted O-methyltransferase YrrM
MRRAAADGGVNDLDRLFSEAMDMTPSRWIATGSYLVDVFGAQDAQLATLMPRAVAAGLPDIAVSPDVGRMLMLLAGMTGGGQGARTALELGTLAGYSGIWIARGLAPGGRLISVEAEPAHADFAQREFDAAGVSASVEIRRGRAMEVLPALAAEWAPGSVDFVFIDAAKREYPDYFALVRPLIATGGLLVADNVLGSHTWWIDLPAGRSADHDGADRFNHIVAADPDFEAVAVPIREGVLIARRVR